MKTTLTLTILTGEDDLLDDAREGNLRNLQGDRLSLLDFDVDDEDEGTLTLEWTADDEHLMYLHIQLGYFYCLLDTLNIEYTAEYTHEG